MNFLFYGAQNRTRTDTGVTPLAPEASASTYFAIWALVYLFQDKSITFATLFKYKLFSLSLFPLWLHLQLPLPLYLRLRLLHLRRLDLRGCGACFIVSYAYHSSAEKYLLTL